MDVIEALVARLLRDGVGSDETINPLWRDRLVEFKAILEQDGCLTPDVFRALVEASNKNEGG